MNPRLGLLQPYPFEQLRKLLGSVTPPAGLKPVNLSIGEPQHPTPALLKDALTANLSALSRYPLARGLPEFRAMGAFEFLPLGCLLDALQRRFMACH